MDQEARSEMTPEEKRRGLCVQRAAALKLLPEHGAITQARRNKILCGLTVKMGYDRNITA